MGKISLKSGQKVSFFPFLSILLCLLGSLLLIGGTILGFSLETEGLMIVDASLQKIGGENDKEPLYVEWNGSALTIHPTGEKIPLNLAPFNLLDSQEEVNRTNTRIANAIRETPFADVLSCIEAHNNSRYVVFLIRPTGFDNFLHLREFILSKGMDIGYEAVGQHWNILESGHTCESYEK